MKLDKVKKVVGYNLRVDSSELKIIYSALELYHSNVTTQINDEEDEDFVEKIKELINVIKEFK